MGVYGAAGFLFGPNQGMYSLIMYFIGARVIDMVEMGGISTKAVMIVTENGKAIADQIYLRLGRTVTYIPAHGYVSAEAKDMLYCVITRIELSTMRKIIEHNDYSAFMSVSDVSEIIGNHIKSNGPLLRQLPPIETEETDKYFSEIFAA